MIVISDLDGTLSDNSVKKQFPGNNEVYLIEAPHEPVNEEVVKLYLDPIFDLRIILTARPYFITVYGEKVDNFTLTKEWLRMRNIDYDYLSMRSEFALESVEEKVARFGLLYKKYNEYYNCAIFLEDNVDIINEVLKQYGDWVVAHLVVNGKIKRITT